MPLPWLVSAFRPRRTRLSDRRRAQDRRRRITLEALEDRTVLSTFTWNGSVSNAWSDTANWTVSNGASHVGGPGTADVVVFDGGAVNSTFDATAAGTISKLTITSGYTGSISLQADLATTGDYSQSGGTVSVNATHLKIGGSFTVSTATFNAGTSTVRFDGPNTATVSTGSTSLYDVVFNRTGSLVASPSMNVGHNLTIDSLLALGGQVNVAGDVAANDASVTGSGVVNFNGSGPQALSVGHDFDQLPNVAVNKSAASTLSLGANKLSVFGDWIYTSGKVAAGTSTVRFDGPNTATVTSGSTSFNNVIVNRTGSLNVTDKLTVGGSLTIDQVLNIGAPLGGITVGGDLTSNDASVGGTTNITMVTASNATIKGGDFPSGGIIINKLSGSVVTAAVTTPLRGPLSLINLNSILGSFQVAGNVTTSDAGVGTDPINDPVLIFTGTAVQTLTALVPNGQVPGLGFNKTGGSFTLVSNANNNAVVGGVPTTALGVTGGWKVYATNTALVNLAGTNVKFAPGGGLNGSRTIDTGNSAGFNNVEFASGSGSTVTVTKMIVNGLLSLTNLGIISGTIDARGDVTTSDASVTSGPGTILFNGTADQNLSATSSGQVPGVRIDKTIGTLSFGSNTIGVTGDWTYVKGSVNVAGSTIAFQGYGSRTVDAGAGPAMAFNNVEITKGSGDTLTITNKLDVDGNLTINQVGVLTAALGAITVGGDLTSNDTSVGGTTNITMDTATDAKITGGDFPGGGIIINKLSGSVVTAAIPVATPLRGPLSLISLGILKGTFAVAGDVTTSDNGVGGNDNSSPVLVFKGSGNQTLKAAAGLDIYGNPAQVPGVKIDKSGGKLTLDPTNPIGVIGSWIVDSTNNSTFTTTNSKVIFWMYSDPTINTGGGAKPMAFNDVLLAPGSGSTITVVNMVVNGNLEIVNVGLINGADIAVKGNVTTSDAGVEGTSSILFNGAGNQNLTATTAYNQVSNVKIAKPSGWFILGSNAIGVTGNWSYTGGQIDSTGNNSTVAFVGYGDATINTGQYNPMANNCMAFDNVEISKGSGTSVTIVSGTSLTALGNVTVNGAYSIAGIIQMAWTGKATLTAADGNFRGAGLVIKKSNATDRVQLGSNLSNVSYLEIKQGTLDVQGYALAVAGNMMVCPQGTLAITANQDNQVTVNGDLTFKSGSKVNITGVTGLSVSGSSYDVIVVTGGHSLVNEGVVVSVPADYAFDIPVGSTTNGKLKLTKD